MSTVYDILLLLLWLLVIYAAGRLIIFLWTAHKASEDDRQKDELLSDAYDHVVYHAPPRLTADQFEELRRLEGIADPLVPGSMGALIDYEESIGVYNPVVPRPRWQTPFTRLIK